MSERVFVYGTLRKGGSNDFRMEGCERVGRGTVRGRIYRIDWYPGLVTGEDGEVAGEVYEVGPEAMAALDAFEGLAPGEMEGGGYRRVKVAVALETGDVVEAWAWEWIGEVDAAEWVSSGDWLKRG